MTVPQLTVIPNVHRPLEVCEFGLDDTGSVVTVRSPLIAWAIEAILTHDGVDTIVTPITPEVLPEVWCLWYPDGRFVFPMDSTFTSLVEAEAYARTQLLPTPGPPVRPTRTQEPTLTLDDLRKAES